MSTAVTDERIAAIPCRIKGAGQAKRQRRIGWRYRHTCARCSWTMGQRGRSPAVMGPCSPPFARPRGVVTADTRHVQVDS
jgi:hypothetical protein